MSNRKYIWILLPLGGCELLFTPDGRPASGRDTPPGETADTGAPPADAYTGPGDTEPGAAWDDAAATPAVQRVIGAALGWNATPVVNAYSRAMASASGDCPTRTRDGADERWIARCTTGAGARFDGYVQVDAFADSVEGSATWDGTFYYLAAVIDTADGFHLDGGGSARIQTGEGRDGGSTYRAWYSFLQGTIGWDGAGSDGTWLVEDVTPNLSMSVRDYPSDGSRSVSVDGAVGVDDAYVSAVTFDAFRVSGGDDGGRCHAEPEGVLGVRDAGGSWYEVTFDPVDRADEADCDGCGTVTLGGEAVGRLCLDVSPLTSWSSAPW